VKTRKEVPVKETNYLFFEQWIIEDFAQEPLIFDFNIKNAVQKRLGVHKN